MSEPHAARKILRPNPFAGDDGSVPPALAEALAEGDPTQRLLSVVRAMAGSRVIVPVVAHAHPGREDDGSVSGHVTHRSGDVVADACAAAATVSVRTPDGRAALPVFSSMEAMRAWNDTARPVPVHAPRAALASVSESDGLIVLDPASPVAVLLPRPAVWALGQQRDWVPSWQDPELPGLVARALAGITVFTGCRLERGRTSELRVLLAVRPAAGRDEVHDAVTAAQQALASDSQIVDRVDSLELAPIPVS